ncbi:cobalt-precorrin-8X methylmutase [bacterium BMS3Abin06]|nr:cobalt-precorrin-8X methylmutase [bacterium BMS3Abin06]
MKKIILAGHGSPDDSANNLGHVAELLHEMMHPGCGKDCVRVAYLKFGNPGIMEAITSCVRDGAKKVIVHPYFLTGGTHVSKDIPDIIEEAGEKYPGVGFICTEPLGVHNKIASVVLERIEAAAGFKPEEIEKKSFDIISGEVDLSDLPEERHPVVKRVIHTTADFEFKNSLVFHADAIKAGVAAIRAGKDILTDVEMVRTGINKKLLERWGGKVICNIRNTEHRTQNTDKKTRTETGIEQALKENNNIGIIAIGNAPTALYKTIEILNDSELRTPNSELLVIGVPVGFVKAVESKAFLAGQGFPFITNISRKGGSTVAVAIVNALLKIAQSS